MSSRPEDVRLIAEAVSHGIAGDQDHGLAMLQPLVDAGPRSTFALLGGLAELAAFTALRNQRPGEAFAMPVEDVRTGEPADPSVLPVPLRFAARFVTAWANRDQDTAWALFHALAEEAERTGSSDLGDGVSLVYSMAVATSEEIVREQRAKRTRAPGFIPDDSPETTS